MSSTIRGGVGCPSFGVGMGMGHGGGYGGGHGCPPRPLPPRPLPPRPLPPVGSCLWGGSRLPPVGVWVAPCVGLPVGLPVGTCAPVGWGRGVGSVVGWGGVIPLPPAPLATREATRRHLPPCPLVVPLVPSWGHALPSWGPVPAPCPMGGCPCPCPRPRGVPLLAPHGVPLPPCLPLGAPSVPLGSSSCPLVPSGGNLVPLGVPLG